MVVGGAVGIGISYEYLCFRIEFPKPVAGVPAKGNNKLREGERSVKACLGAFIIIDNSRRVFRTLGRRCHTLEPKPSIDIEAFQAAENISFQECQVIVRTWKTLCDGQSRLVGPRVTVERTRKNVGNEAAPGSIVIDIDKLENIEIA